MNARDLTVSRQSGATLPEAVLSLAIMAVLAAGFGTAVSNSRTYSIQTYAYSKQNDAAQGTLVQEMIKYGDSMVAWKLS